MFSALKWTGESHEAEAEDRCLVALPLILHNKKLDYYYHKCTAVQVIHSNILPLVKIHEETIPQSLADHNTSVR